MNLNVYYKVKLSSMGNLKFIYICNPKNFVFQLQRQKETSEFLADVELKKLRSGTKFVLR